MVAQHHGGQLEVVRFSNPLAFGSGLGERILKKVGFQLWRSFSRRKKDLDMQKGVYLESSMRTGPVFAILVKIFLTKVFTRASWLSSPSLVILLPQFGHFCWSHIFISISGGAVLSYFFWLFPLHLQQRLMLFKEKRSFLVWQLHIILLWRIHVNVKVVKTNQGLVKWALAQHWVGENEVRRCMGQAKMSFLPDLCHGCQSRTNCDRYKSGKKIYPLFRTLYSRLSSRRSQAGNLSTKRMMLFFRGATMHRIVGGGEPGLFTRRVKVMNAYTL